MRDFAKATGQLAKKDKLDARVLLAYGQALNPRETLVKSVDEQEMQALVERRRQLVAARTAEKNRRKLAAGVASALAAHSLTLRTRPFGKRAMATRLTNSIASDNLRVAFVKHAFVRHTKRREMMLMSRFNSSYRVIISVVAA